MVVIAAKVLKHEKPPGASVERRSVAAHVSLAGAGVWTSVSKISFIFLHPRARVLWRGCLWCVLAPGLERGTRREVSGARVGARWSPAGETAGEAIDLLSRSGRNRTRLWSTPRVRWASTRPAPSGQCLHGDAQEGRGSRRQTGRSEGLRRLVESSSVLFWWGSSPWWWHSSTRQCLENTVAWVLRRAFEQAERRDALVKGDLALTKGCTECDDGGHGAGAAGAGRWGRDTE